LADRRHDRNPASRRRLEGDRAAQPAGKVEEFGAVLGDERLVGGDQILAVLEQIDRHRAGRLEAPDEQRGHRDRLVAGDVANLSRDSILRQRQPPLLGQILDDRLGDHDRPAGVPGDVVGRAHQQPHHSRADRTKADDTDADGLVHEGGRAGWKEGTL